jgi:hypothetical protein
LSILKTIFRNLSCNSLKRGKSLLKRLPPFIIEDLEGKIIIKKESIGLMEVKSLEHKDQNGAF